MILPSDQSRIIEQTKFTYFPLVKAFEKQKKNSWRSKTFIRFKGPLGFYKTIKESHITLEKLEE